MLYFIFEFSYFSMLILTVYLLNYGFIHIKYKRPARAFTRLNLCDAPLLAMRDASPSVSACNVRRTSPGDMRRVSARHCTPPLMMRDASLRVLEDVRESFQCCREQRTVRMAELGILFIVRNIM